MLGNALVYKVSMPRKAGFLTPAVLLVRCTPPSFPIPSFRVHLPPSVVSPHTLASIRQNVRVAFPAFTFCLTSPRLCGAPASVRHKLRFGSDRGRNTHCGVVEHGQLDAPPSGPIRPGRVLLTGERNRTFVRCTVRGDQPGQGPNSGRRPGGNPEMSVQLSSSIRLLR